MSIKDHLVVPSKFAWIYSEFKDRDIKILDVGFGNHSPSITRKWFPRSTYYGVDRDIYNCSEDDMKVLEKFYKADLDHSDLSEIADGQFDLIIFSHVIEHIANPAKALRLLGTKLKAGGTFVILTPNVNSVHFPRMQSFFGLDSCPVNFYDDPTHIKPIPLKDIAEVLELESFVVNRSGVYRNWLKAAIMPIDFIFRKLGLKSRSRMPIGVWDFYGFECMLIATKN